MEMVKGRTLEVGQAVEVYYNLHKKKYSIRDRVSGLVVAHADQVILTDAIFKVSEAGRQRVLREKRKNVHAFVVGKFMAADIRLVDTGNAKQAYYNPYKTSCFVDKATGEALKGAGLVHCQDKQAYYAERVFT